MQIIYFTMMTPTGMCHEDYRFTAENTREAGAKFEELIQRAKEAYPCPPHAHSEITEGEAYGNKFRVLGITSPNPGTQTHYQHASVHWFYQP